MNIAIEGCLHGELDLLYSKLKEFQDKMKIKIDLLIVCGDFQAIRDQNDLNFMHCPPKYRTMGDFHKYYTQKVITPILTVFIGGNHQAVNYLRDAYFGGWLAKNIYYLGQAGSIYVKKGDTSLRITGMSGIYDHKDFKFNLKTQQIPLDGHSQISSYHIKQIQIYRLQLLSRIGQAKRLDPKTFGQNDTQFDIFLSHDWPKNIANYGDLKQLYRYKEYLKEQIEKGILGSPPGEKLMKLAKPSYWFSAHMHSKYACLYPHNQKQFTHFLSLDKCLDKRPCLQILRFQKTNQNQKGKFSENLKQSENKQQVRIQFDKTWLAVLAMTSHLQNLGIQFYKYEKNQLVLTNQKQMEKLIYKYPNVYSNLKFKTLFPLYGNPIQITGKLLRKLQIQQEIFEGIIFQRKKKIYKQKNQKQKE